MLLNILLSIALIALFMLLCKSADLVVLNIKKIGESLGIKIVFLGIVLGMITSLPEAAIGFNALTKDVPSIAVGHLMGGVIVLLGLILGISIVLNRKIKTEKKSWPFLVTLIYLFLPLVLGLKGELNFYDGIILIMSYLIIFYFLYQKNKKEQLPQIKLSRRNDSKKRFTYIIMGIIGIIIFSELIIKTTIFFLDKYSISAFIIGLLFYSIGTNLPELTIAIRSFKKKVGNLSFNNLIGASITHVLILGILSFAKTIKIEVDASYIFLTVFSFFFFLIIYIFYRSDRFLSRLEGLTIILLYTIFVLVQVFLQIK